jgi:SAM-dependent methyltransferase
VEGRFVQVAAVEVGDGPEADRPGEAAGRSVGVDVGTGNRLHRDLPRLQARAAGHDQRGGGHQGQDEGGDDALHGSSSGSASYYPGGVEPYLDGAVREAFDAWLEDTQSRFMPPLSFAEVRKGVQALSSLYVERRGRGRLASRALEGRGKRAAFASYYAPLHFLTAWHALSDLEAADRVRRVLDLGCGTGAVGAAAGVACGAARVEGFDRSGWALGEARRTYAAFRLAAHCRRSALPDALPSDVSRLGPADLLAVGWLVNELEPEPQERLLETLLEARRHGARLLLLEPLAGPISPWWEAWQPRFECAGVCARPLKRSLELPAWIARMDKAAGLSHRPLGARVLLG